MNQHLDAAIGFNAEGMAGSGHGFQHATDRCEHGCLTGRLRHDAYALPHAREANTGSPVASRFINRPRPATGWRWSQESDRRQASMGNLPQTPHPTMSRQSLSPHPASVRSRPPRPSAPPCARRRTVPEQHRQHHRHYKRNGDGQRVHPHPIEHRNRQQRGEGECRSRTPRTIWPDGSTDGNTPAEHRAGHSAGRAAGEQPAVDAAVMQMDAVQAQFPKTPPSNPASNAPTAVCRMAESLPRTASTSTPAVAPKQAKFHTPIGPWTKS